MGADLPVSGSESSAPAIPARPRPERLDAVDLLRGVVIVLMALDHVRDFFSDRIFLDPVDLNTTTAAIFLTRWVTHYCAPTFIFLAGTGAYLSGTRGKSKHEQAWFLLSRGLWLALLEVTLVRASWMFNWDYLHHGAGVFWAIGWSMVVLSILVYLPTSAVAVFGVTMIAFHNLLDGKTADQVHLPKLLWVILHSPGELPVFEPVTFGTGYCLIPWSGIMAAGYAFGALLTRARDVRRREVFGLGAALIAVFFFLRFVNVYGDPRPWSKQTTALFTGLSFLNCTKYPPSLLYLLMTLGPAIAALALFDRPLGPLVKPILTLGRVPLFFYLLHIPLIHGGVVLLDHVRYGWSPQATDGPWAVQPNVAPEDYYKSIEWGASRLLETIRPGMIPPDYGVSLPWVYLLWLVVLFILYWPCRWFAGVKQRHPGGWLSYL